MGRKINQNSEYKMHIHAVNNYRYAVTIKTLFCDKKKAC